MRRTRNRSGTTTTQTLAQAGITSIDLTADKTSIVLPDGSRITGQTTFTRSNGTTGIVADSTLAYDAEGHAVKQTVTTTADGAKAAIVQCVSIRASQKNASALEVQP